MLKVSNVTVLNWVRKFSAAIGTDLEINIKETEVIEIDEMSLYTKKKKKIWIWVAIDRNTKEILGYAVSSCGKKTLKMLLKKIKHILCVRYATDKCTE